MTSRTRFLVAVACVVGAAAPATSSAEPPPAPEQAQWPPVLSIQQRLEALRSLFGPAVEISPPVGTDTLAPVRALFRFDSPDDLSVFAVMSNRWKISDGELRGAGLAVAQIVCLLPLAGGTCSVQAVARSTAIIELTLLDPWSRRCSDGTLAVGRLHFGRMDHWADTDWLELSSKRRSLEKVYGFRFPDAMQEATLMLGDGRLAASLTVKGGVKKVSGTIDEADRRPPLYISIAGGVNNKVRIAELKILGVIDVASNEAAVLTGLGKPFWTGGREVTLYYRARGHFRSLLHNGQVVNQQPAVEGVWWPYEGPLLRTTLRLNYGDVLAFELAGVDDEGALHLVGVDVATGRIVLAGHPLIFAAASAQPEEQWYRTPPTNGAGRANVSRAQDESIVKQLRAVLDGDFPGLPVIGPVVGPERQVRLKMQVR